MPVHATSVAQSASHKLKFAATGDAALESGSMVFWDSSAVTEEHRVAFIEDYAKKNLLIHNSSGDFPHFNNAVVWIV